MQPIFLIVGGPGVGKSTTSRELAATFDRSIHIDVDTFRDMVVSGFALPGPDWGEDHVQQVRLARETAIRMALDYAEAGFVAVIDDFYDPNGLAEYRALLDRHATRGVVLYPAQAEARRRNAVRSPGESGAYIDAAIPIAYGFLAPVVEGLAADGWIILDTTEMDVGAAVAAIRDRAGLTSG